MKKALVVRLDEDMHAKLKTLSYETRFPMSVIIREGMKLVIEALEEQNGKETIEATR